MKNIRQAGEKILRYLDGKGYVMQNDIVKTFASDYKNINSARASISIALHNLEDNNKVTHRSINDVDSRIPMKEWKSI